MDTKLLPTAYNLKTKIKYFKSTKKAGFFSIVSDSAAADIDR